MAAKQGCGVCVARSRVYARFMHGMKRCAPAPVKLLVKENSMSAVIRVRDSASCGC